MKDRLTVALHEVSVRRGKTWALRDISLQLRPGERWALLGPNGAGKTQLLKLLSTAVWPTPTGREKIIYRVGRHITDIDDARSRIAYVGAELQDKYSRYDWNPTLRDLIVTGIHRTDLIMRPITRGDRSTAQAMLERCGLTALAGRPFLALSYGQKRLGLLARALVQTPDWLLLDEFYNGLDVDYRGRMDEILDAARACGQSWVAAVHREADVPRGTRRILELAGGQVRDSRTLRRQDLASLRERALEHEPSHVTAATPAGGKSVSRRLPLISIRAADLYVDYRLVLKAVQWELRPGEHWAIYGANGAGKSSFLKLLYGDLSPALGGVVERRGFPRGTPIAEWKARVGFVSPELQTDYARNVCVRDLVISGRYASVGLVDAPTAQDRRVAARWLKFFELSPLAERRPQELSYGQMRRSLFARAMAADPSLLLLDEPLTGLDPEQRALMKRLLSHLIDKGVTLIIAVHHCEDLPHGMTHGLRLHNGAAIPVDSYFAT